jgi:amino acid transporter
MQKKRRVSEIMDSFIFGLFSLAFLFFYGMIQTVFFVKKIKKESEYRRKYRKYGHKLGLYGCISLVLGVVVYYYGVG